ncbi:N-6 DNA methylase [Streptosporangium sp. NBC_01756]|uniref:N-6 DNA methylase n=1 Tax=Streptosporangium sp. NBC_01756 TaxID=2975950 RepID=UPI002DDB3447|nr:N-6 DNA methylase [Streptosporangium sp. NBC_01756]WSC88816.1 SAM-dependent methyltransferase [Streptosporangium sp. NBC_01756]
MMTGHRNLVLGLVYLRAVRQADWANLAEYGNLTPKVLVGWLESVAPGLHQVLREVHFAGPWQRLFGQLVRVVDQAVSARGGMEVYRFLLDWFSSMDGRRGGEFYTPRSLVRVLVEAVAPGPGARIHDPCCGSGEMLVAAAVHASRDGGEIPPVSGLTWTAELSEVARMNLAVHGVAGDVTPATGQALGGWLSETGPFDVIVTNPPFNMSLWKDQDTAYSRDWRYGPPPTHNANFAWLQHVALSLAPGGRAAVLMPNSASASESLRERDIRTGLVEDGRVEAVIALPSHLFYSTGIPATVWLLGRPTSARDEILFIDASGSGRLVDRTHRILTDEDVAAIADSVDRWRHEERGYGEGSGFSRSVPLEEVREHDYVLNPKKYLSTLPESVEGSGADRLHELRRQLERLRLQAVEVDASVDRELRRVGL